MIRKATQIVIPILDSSELSVEQLVKAEQIKNLNIFSVVLKNNC